MTMRTRTLSRMDLDSVVMMDLSMLVLVISKLDALESLRLHVYFTRTLSGAIATALPPPLQRLKILDFFIWLVSISPKPPITSLSLGAQLFPYTPAALQLIISASETLQFFKASRILSPKDCLPNLFPSHKTLRAVTLLVKRGCIPPQMFWHRESTQEMQNVDERGKSYTILTVKLDE
ncbi:hypothetical protein B0H14DRAFT_2712976 [Mycena olivaceomarginata]|nr:hypothetical protein B0H14DRAFT_2712976 [Mycena olivaceomarginata]